MSVRKTPQMLHGRWGDEPGKRSRSEGSLNPLWRLPIRLKSTARRGPDRAGFGQGTVGKAPTE